MTGRPPGRSGSALAPTAPMDRKLLGDQARGLPFLQDINVPGPAPCKRPEAPREGASGLGGQAGPRHRSPALQELAHSCSRTFSGCPAARPHLQAPEAAWQRVLVYFSSHSVICGTEEGTVSTCQESFPSLGRQGRRDGGSKWHLCVSCPLPPCAVLLGLGPGPWVSGSRDKRLNEPLPEQLGRQESVRAHILPLVWAQLPRVLCLGFLIGPRTALLPPPPG